MKYRITFSDVDYGRIIFHGNVWRIVEHAIEELYAENSIDLRNVISKWRIGVPLIESHCKYISPMKYFEEVDVEVNVVDLTRRGYRMLFNIHVLPERRLAVAGYERHRFVDTRQFKGIEVPDEVYSYFSKLQNPKDLYDPQ